MSLFAEKNATTAGFAGLLLMLPIWCSHVSSRNLWDIKIQQYLYKNKCDSFFQVKLNWYDLGKTAEQKGKTGATNGCCGYGADGNHTRLFYLY